MKQHYLLFLVLLLLGCVFIGNSWAEDDSRYPIMRPDHQTWIQWMEDYERAPKAQIDYGLDFMLYRAQGLNYTTSLDLLDLIDYDPNQRNQGGCGNCWVWAGTGVMEIAHEVQEGVFDRHSIQYLNSCSTGFACCGGGLTGFATWYSGEGQALPWSNTNASFADGGRRCSDGSSLVTCASIGTMPDFPINSITAVTIETHTGQSAAIANIKNILNQDKGIYFGFALPDSSAWGDFFDFWDGVGGETEATLWGDTDTYCGQEWNEAAGEAGGHAVLILGYNDDDADPANHYWLALNSWGTAGGLRLNGLFRIPMDMNYDCSYPDNGTAGFWAFSFLTLDIEFGNAPPTSDPGGPYEADCMGVATSIQLDGSASFDPEGGPLFFEWTTDCAGGSFDDDSSQTPVLTISTAPGCTVECSVFLTVSDNDGASDVNAEATVTVTDSDPPEITCPPDITIECDEATDPGNTGIATATDTCDPAPSVSFTDSVVPGVCPAESVITRTWTTTDVCGNESSCMQTITVVDTTPPVIACNTPENIAPNDAPITFTASATDNCDAAPYVEILDYRCFKTTKKGKIIDKAESCVVTISGDSVTINDSGGVGDNIVWSVRATDCSGNLSDQECSVPVVNPNHEKLTRRSGHKKGSRTRTVKTF